MDHTYSNFLGDIPHDVAKHAYERMSRAPGDCGTQAIVSYAENLFEDYQWLAREVGESINDLNREFTSYREGMKIRYLAVLRARSKCTSASIVGPSNFSIEESISAATHADCKNKELLAYRDRAVKKIVTKLRPNSVKRVEPTLRTSPGCSEGKRAHFEDNLADGRVRLKFRSKPNVEVVKMLKRGGFRWVPALGVWSARRNSSSLAVGKHISGMIGI